jgi:NAD(P)-dependent dehydrogenase (short-subunit alcohol dehydrogenase family)
MFRRQPLINNAGICYWKGFLAPDSIQAAQSEMETNYFGPLLLSRAFTPILAKNGGGTIVNVLSILSWIAVPDGERTALSRRQLGPALNRPLLLRPDIKDSLAPNFWKLGYRCASIRRVEHQLTTRQVRVTRKLPRESPTGFWPMDLPAATKCSIARKLLLALLREVSINLRATAVRQQLRRCAI